MAPAGQNADPLSAVNQLQSVVHALAPVLRPQILPKGTAYGIDLLIGLCKTDEQKQALHTLIRESKPAANDVNEDEDANEIEAQIVGSFDMKQGVFNLEKLQWMPENSAIIHEFARFMELQLDSPEEAADIITHFLETNGHDPENTSIAEQCFSAAFALQTILRAFPRPPFAIEGKIIEITADSDIQQVFAPLFLTKKSTSRKAESKKAKAQKSKKRKST